MKIGYARVSTQDQKLELQIEALEKFGCEILFKEKISAVKQRPQLDKMVKQLRKGDIVVVWKLDRLGRSLKHLVYLIGQFKEMEVQFVSINDNINTTTPQGRLMFNLFATFAEFERELISERTKAGLQAARTKGRIGGRKPGLNKANRYKAYAALGLLEDKKKNLSTAEIRKQLNISKTTYYRYIEWAKENRGNRKVKG